MKKEIRRNWNKRKSVYFIIKRILGFILALFGLIVLSPVMIITAIAIKLDSKGPVIFKQPRSGRYGKVFYVWKFRSMYVDNDVHDFSKEDEHTRVGNIIRKTSIDELPQLFNILAGHMAFIGPRPWITDYYDNMTKKQRHRCDVLPGITGLAQVNGRNAITIFDKINYDLEYIDNYGLKEDIKIIFLTIKVVLSKVAADAGKNTIQTELDDLKTQEIKVEEIVNAHSA